MRSKNLVPLYCTLIKPNPRLLQIHHQIINNNNKKNNQKEWSKASIPGAQILLPLCVVFAMILNVRAIAWVLSKYEFRTNFF